MKKKRIISIFFFVILFFSIVTFASLPKKNNYQAVSADEKVTEKVNNFDFYQFKHFSETTANNEDYITPLEYHKIYQATNGTYNAGELSIISEANLENLGYKTPQGAFNYNLYTFNSSQITLSYSFKHSETDTYKIADNSTTTVDELDLKSPIHKGVVIILKRGKEDSSWTYVKHINFNTDINQVNNINYEPDGSDLTKGVYIRFISAYQYYTFTKGSLFKKSKYQFYDILQRTTVYLVPGGTTLKFVTNVTENQEHSLPYKQYVNQSNTTGKLNCNDENLTTDYPISSLTIEGQIIKGSEVKSNYTGNNVPEYVYNGEDTLKIKYKNLASSTLNNNRINDASKNDAQTLSLITYLLITYDLNGKEYKEDISSINWEQIKSENCEQSESKIIGIGTGALILEKLNEDSSWEVIKANNDIGNKDSFEITFDAFSSEYRLIYLASFKENENIITISNISYFRVKVNIDRYQSAFENGEGIDSSLSSYSYVKGLTLENGSASFSNIQCVIPSSSYKVEVSYNDGEYVKQTQESQLYKKEGKYRFKVTNDVNEISYTTLYIIDAKDDNGKSTYLENGKFILEDDDNPKRLYNPNSSIPSYGLGAKFRIKGDPFRPGIYGKISIVNTDGSLTTIQEINNLHTILEGSFNKVGQYYVEINSNDPSTSGDRIKFTIRFNIKDEKNFTPRINYDLLHSGVNSSSLMAKGYVVSYKSKGVGSYLFTFPYNQKGLNEAWDFSEKIEARKVIKNNDGTYSYNNKTFTSKFDLYAEIHENAKNLITSTLINKSFDFTLDEDYELGNIVDTSIEHDKYVVTSEDVFKELATDLVYINDYTFYQVRKYESSSVKMIDPDGLEIEIPYGENVNSYLTKTGIYTVIEENWCGESVYQVAYCNENDNKTNATIRYFDDNNQIKEETLSKDYTNIVSSSSIIFKDIIDSIDPVVLVTITYKNNDVIEGSKSYSGNDLNNLIIDKNGTYEIKFTNRLGYSFQITIKIENGKNDTPFEPHKDLDNELSYCNVGYTKEDK